jgi:hypothetical protein
LRVQSKTLRLAAVLSVCVATTALAAPPATLDDVVIFARDRLAVQHGTRLYSGQFVVNSPSGEARFRRSFVASASTQIVANTVAFRPRAPRPGPTLFDVYANAFDPGVAGAIITPAPAGVSLPLFTFPTAPAITPGTDICPTPGHQPGDCVIRKKDGPITLLPGNYNRLIVKGNAAVYFAGGVYQAASIRVGGGGRVFFNAPTTLFIAERAIFGRRVQFGPPGDSTLNGRCITMHVAGIDRSVRFGGISDVTATISAPNGSLRLGSFGTYRGNFTAATAEVGLNVVLQSLPVLTMPCS